MAQQITNYDRTPFVLGDVRSRKVTIENIEVTEQALVRGTVLGRAATGEYVVCKSAAVDGTQYPKAILANDITLAGSASGTAMVHISGDFNTVGLVFNGTDTLATAVDDQPLEDWMKAQSLFVETMNELSDYDNQ